MSVLETLDAYAKDRIWPKVVSVRSREQLPENFFTTYEDSSTTSEGCDTCGPYADYSVDISFFAPIGFGTTREEATLDYWKREFYGLYTYRGTFSDLLMDIHAWEASQ